MEELYYNEIQSMQTNLRNVRNLRKKSLEEKLLASCLTVDVDDQPFGTFMRIWKIADADLPPVMALESERVVYLPSEAVSWLMDQDPSSSSQHNVGDPILFESALNKICDMAHPTYHGIARYRITKHGNNTFSPYLLAFQQATFDPEVSLVFGCLGLLSYDEGPCSRNML